MKETNFLMMLNLRVNLHHTHLRSLGINFLFLLQWIIFCLFGHIVVKGLWKLIWEVETFVQAQGDFGKVYDSTFKILYWTVPSWILDNLSGFMFEVANKVLHTNQHLTFFLELFHASAWNSKLMIFINVGKRLFYKYVAKMK